MPHDRDGSLLSVGDEVLVPARVKELHLTEEFCNVTLETAQPMYPGNAKCSLVLNAKQVVKGALVLALLAFLAAPAFAGNPFLGRDWRSRIAKDQDAGLGGSAPASDAAPLGKNVPEGTNAASPLQSCLNCAPPFLGVWGAMETIISGAADNQVKPVGGIYLEAPVTIGEKKPTTLGRVFARLTVAPKPGGSEATQTAASTILNFDGFEAQGGVKRVVGRGQGITTAIVASVWLGTRFSTDPEPLDHMIHGWGVGVGFHSDGGHWANAVCGTDSSIGDDGAVQCRTWGKIIVPKTVGIGSVYFDALMSFFQPSVLANGEPAPDPTLKRHVMVHLGVGVNADAIFGAFKGSR